MGFNGVVFKNINQQVALTPTKSNNRWCHKGTIDYITTGTVEKMLTLQLYSLVGLQHYHPQDIQPSCWVQNTITLVIIGWYTYGFIALLGGCAICIIITLNNTYVHIYSIFFPYFHFRTQNNIWFVSKMMVAGSYKGLLMIKFVRVIRLPT